MTSLKRADGRGKQKLREKKKVRLRFEREGKDLLGKGKSTTGVTTTTIYRGGANRSERKTKRKQGLKRKEKSEKAAPLFKEDRKKSGADQKNIV